MFGAVHQQQLGRRIGLGGHHGGEKQPRRTRRRGHLLESAFFHPVRWRDAPRSYNFASDASHRFERGVDFRETNVDGIERATRLILDLCGGEPGPTVDKSGAPPQRKARAHAGRAPQKILGVPVPATEC